MISYGGTYLSETPPALSAWIEANIPARTVFEHYRWPRLTDPNMDPRAHLDWFLSRPVRIGTYFNPWGASRWGMGYFTVTESQLTAIRTAAYSGGTYKSLPLIIDSGIGQVVSTNLWMLPAVPLTAFDAPFPPPKVPVPRLSTAGNYYLLPLVDDRFFWWEIQAAPLINQRVTTWAAWYALLALALGIKLTPSAPSVGPWQAGSYASYQNTFYVALVDTKNPPGSSDWFAVSNIPALTPINTVNTVDAAYLYPSAGLAQQVDLPFPQGAVTGQGPMGSTGIPGILGRTSVLPGSPSLAGTYVLHNGTYYVALVDTGSTPGTDSTWAPVFSGNGPYGYLPLLLDATAAACGQRIVRTLAGQYFAMPASSAFGLSTVQIATYKRFKVAGGSLDLGVLPNA